jgi:2-polyprenyl-6-methoxyphenol hydroxylase-like FAD-dependent oxidoreductase
MKIIIVGAGIAGLSTYLSLQKYLAKNDAELRITIYESHQPTTGTGAGGGPGAVPEDATFDDLSRSTAIVGGGLGVSPNGMRLLRELSEDLHGAVTRAGFVCENFVFRGSRGWKLMCSPTSDFRGVKTGLPAGQQEWCVTVGRHALREALLAQVGPDKVVYKRVRSAEPRNGSARAKVIFDDGSWDDADMVIGADGVRSSVLKGIFSEEAEEASTKPVYE